MVTLTIHAWLSRVEIAVKQKIKKTLQYYFLPIYEVKEFFNIASLIENCLTCLRIPHTYPTTTIYHEKVYGVVFNLQGKTYQ